jgi:hypothetical protein
MSPMKPAASFKRRLTPVAFVVLGLATMWTSSGLDWRFPASVAGVGIFMALVYILLRRTANYSDRRFGFVVLLCLMFLSVLARSRQ